MVARCAFCDARYMSGYVGYPTPHRSTRIAAFVILARMEAERVA